MSPAEMVDRWSGGGGRGGTAASDVAVSGVRGFCGGWTLNDVVLYPRLVRLDVRGWHSFWEVSQFVQTAYPVWLLA